MEAILLAVLTQLPALIAAGVEVTGLINKATTALQSGTDPTSAEWAAVNAELDALTAQLNRDPT